MSSYSFNEEGRFHLTTVAEAQKIAVPSPVGNATNRYELDWFIKEIKKAFRGCEVRPDHDSSITHRDTVYYVYYPEDEYTMGWIEVGFCHTKEKIVYSVYSRDITNNKHTNYSSEFRTKVTALQGQAIQNAKKYLRRFTHREVVLASAGPCRTVVRNAVEDTTNKYCTAWRQLFGADLNNTHEKTVTPMLNEMYTLLDTGHEFLDKTIPDNLTSLRVTKEVKDQSDADANMPMYAVRVYERLGKQAFDVCPLEDLTLMARNAKLEFATYYDDLPEGVLGKLSTLSICEDGAYVPQVGYRHSEGVFYVTQ
jgi:hypothetical protein